MRLTQVVFDPFHHFRVCCVFAGLLSESFHSLTRRAEQEALAKVHLWTNLVVKSTYHNLWLFCHDP
jgi:hypothetical protein